MKKKIYFVYILAVILIGNYSCEFSPSEIPMTEIEKPSANAPAIRIELNPEMDTLRLSEPAWITYSVETGSNELYGIYFQIDDDEIVNLNYESSQKVSAYVNTNLLEDGVHELKINTYTATSSGSVADKIGSEQYWYEIKWPVFINKNAKENFSLNEIEFVPEGIKVSWPKYNYADFHRYEFAFNMNHLLNEKNDITNPDQNFYINNKYVEGIYTYYSVFVYFTTGGFLFDNISYYKPIDSPIVNIDEDRNVDIYWTHSENEQYVKLYYIETSAPNYGVSEQYDITDLKDTTLLLQEKVGFGGDYQLQLTYIPQGYSGYHSALDPAGGLTNFALGDSTPKFQRAFHLQSENSLLIYNEGTFSKYNFIEGEIAATIPVSMLDIIYDWNVVCSPDGNYFGYIENQELVICSSIDMSIADRINIETFDGYNLILNDISISNNGLIAIVDPYKNLRIFDMKSDENIYEIHFEDIYNLREAIISPDGQYLAIILKDYGENTVSLVYYSFNGEQLNELGRVNGVGKDIGAILAFSPQAEQKLVISRWHSMYEYTIELRDSRTFELLYSVEVPMFYVPIIYDFANDKAIAQYQYFPTEKNSLMIELKTGTIRKVVQFTGREPMIYTGGTVFAGNGRAIKPDDYIIE